MSSSYPSPVTHPRLDLNRKLNIRGIPHFLIYDPQGNLHTYNAPRPSSSQILPLLRSLK